jgi:hypothetical protein
MNRPPWLVSVSKSIFEIGTFGLLYSDDIRTCSFPSCIEIVVESMGVLIFSGLCGRQNIPLRGHRDSEKLIVEQENVKLIQNQGNFREIL